jgi:hypothetical protein
VPLVCRENSLSLDSFNCSHVNYLKVSQVSTSMLNLTFASFVLVLDHISIPVSDWDDAANQIQHLSLCDLLIRIFRRVIPASLAFITRLEIDDT